MRFDELTEENLFLYAAKHYYKPQLSDIEEFYEDLKRYCLRPQPRAKGI